MKLKDIFNTQINETPIVGNDDMYDGKFTDIEKQPIAAISHYIKLGDFEIITQNENRSAKHTVHFYRTPAEFKYVFGIIEDDIFYELGYIILKPERNIPKYKNVYEVDAIEVANIVRKNGLSTELYRFLVLQLRMNVLCGGVQYFGARKLWSRLSRQPDMAVDVVDMNTPKIIEKNAILKHGQNNDEFDPRYWDTFPSAAKFDGIRFVLRPK